MRRVTITIGYDETDPDLFPAWVPKSALLEGYSVKLEEAGVKKSHTLVCMEWDEATAKALEYLQGRDIKQEEEENEA